jgi:hypothetical protein
LLAVTYNVHRRDACHREVIKTLRDLGCSVRDLSQCGDRGSDLSVGLCGRNFDIECKSGNETLSAEQREYYENWKGAPVVVLRNSSEAQDWVIEVRQRLCV